MIIVYEVYNKFDKSVYEETSSEQKAYSTMDYLNAIDNINDPFNYQWIVSSKVVYDNEM